MDKRMDEDQGRIPIAEYSRGKKEKGQQEIDITIKHDQEEIVT